MIRRASSPGRSTLRSPPAAGQLPAPRATWATSCTNPSCCPPFARVFGDEPRQRRDVAPRARLTLDVTRPRQKLRFAIFPRIEIGFRWPIEALHRVPFCELGFLNLAYHSASVDKNEVVVLGVELHTEKIDPVGQEFALNCTPSSDRFLHFSPNWRSCPLSEVQVAGSLVEVGSSDPFAQNLIQRIEPTVGISLGLEIPCTLVNDLRSEFAGDFSVASNSQPRQRGKSASLIREQYATTVEKFTAAGIDTESRNLRTRVSEKQNRRRILDNHIAATRRRPVARTLHQVFGPFRHVVLPSPGPWPGGGSVAAWARRAWRAVVIWW